MSTKNKSLIAAIKAVGTQAKLAEAIGTNQQVVSWWLNKSNVVPAEHVIAIEAATKRAGSLVSRYDLRPDIYPREDATI